jgi:hypothetical protein
VSAPSAQGIRSKTQTQMECCPCVRKMIFFIKVYVTLLDYLKIPQITILGDWHV